MLAHKVLEYLVEIATFKNLEVSPNMGPSSSLTPSLDSNFTYQHRSAENVLGLHCLDMGYFSPLQIDGSCYLVE